PAATECAVAFLLNHRCADAQFIARLCAAPPGRGSAIRVRSLRFPAPPVLDRYGLPSHGR
ncbi:MAG: hypothetical protein ACKOJF_15905, partial [Planctomycetaceae bacterium]